MTEKKAASAKPKPEPKLKRETARTPQHRPYTGCGDPRRWRQRLRNR